MGLQTTDVDPGLKARLDGHSTVADKIRLLDEEGMARADIARILGKRYQHVRNVLERDAAKKAEAVRTGASPSSAYLKVAGDGSVHIPAAMAEAAGWRSGQSLNISVDEDGVRLLPTDVVIARLQSLVAGFDRGDGSAVDELIADRRAEAVRE